MLFFYIFLFYNNKNINILFSKIINYFIYGLISLLSQKYYSSYMLYITLKNNTYIFFIKNIFYIKYLITLIITVICITRLLFLTYFNEKKKFNIDSVYICSISTFLTILLILPILFFGTKVKQELKNYVIVATVINFFTTFYFWIIYFLRCKKVITEINRDLYIFIWKMFKPIVLATLVCFSSSIAILFLPVKSNNIKVIYQVLNTSLNLIYPFIDMYTYVRSELDKFIEESKNNRMNVK